MLEKVFDLLKEDLKAIKKSGFKIPKKMSYYDGVERNISKDFSSRPLPKELQDVWLLWVYYHHNDRRDDTGFHGRNENDMKLGIIGRILNFYLASCAPDALFEVTDFWVDDKWNLFFFEKEEEGFGTI
jgi:hypothetical protein